MWPSGVTNGETLIPALPNGKFQTTFPVRGWSDQTPPSPEQKTSCCKPPTGRHVGVLNVVSYGLGLVPLIQRNSPVALLKHMKRWAGMAKRPHLGSSPHPTMTALISRLSSKITGTFVRPPYVEIVPYSSCRAWSQTSLPVSPSRQQK